jgi:hypothetical protein
MTERLADLHNISQGLLGKKALAKQAALGNFAEEAALTTKDVIRSLCGRNAVFQTTKWKSSQQTNLTRF